MVFSLPGAVQGVREFLFGPQTTKQQLVKFLNESLAETLVSTQTNCTTNAAVSQVQSFSGDPSVANVPNREFPQNRSCEDCSLQLFGGVEIDGAEGIIEEYRAYQLEAEALGIPVQRYEDEITAQQQSLIQESQVGGSLGGVENACQVVCSASIFANNQQSSHLTISEACATNVNLRQSVLNQMNARIEQNLKESKDFLANIASVLSTKTNENMIIELQNRVKNLLTDSELTKLVQTIIADQSQTVEPGSYSIVFANNRQENLITSISTLASRNKVFQDVLTDTETTAYQKLLDEQNTIKSILDPIRKAIDDVGNQFKTQAYIIMIAIAVAIIVIAIVAVLLRRRKYVAKKRQEKSRKEAIATLSGSGTGTGAGAGAVGATPSLDSILEGKTQQRDKSAQKSACNTLLCSRGLTDDVAFKKWAIGKGHPENGGDPEEFRSAWSCRESLQRSEPGWKLDCGQS